jgi:hypothetical protein
MAAPEVKPRRVGRPRKYQPTANVPVLGLVKQPSVSDSIFELRCGYAEALKKAVNYLLAVSTDPIDCRFREDYVTMCVLDTFKKSRIQLKFNTSKMLHYYCSRPTNFAISHPILDTLMTKLDKTYDAVMIFARSVSADEVIYRYESKLECPYQTVKLVHNYEPMAGEEDFDDPNYMIKFELASKAFKKKLSDVKLFGSPLTISQNGRDQPLTFNYSMKDGDGLKSIDVFDSAAIKLDSKIEAEKIFSISFPHKYWNAIASSAVQDDKVEIRLSTDRPIMTTMSFAEGSIVVKALTNIF